MFSSCLENINTPDRVDNSFYSLNNFIKGKRYEERKEEQEILRRALAQLEYFNGDGQLRFENSYNGSLFWFSPQVIMTNAHNLVLGTLNNLEYIAFPNLVFYKRSRENQVKNYISLRLARAQENILKARKILSERIANLKALIRPLSTREQAILASYEQDLLDLNKHKERTLSDVLFIPIDQALEKFWLHPHGNDPDLGLIILKKPIQQIIADHHSSLHLKKEHFAENNLYNPSQHGWLYGGTPVYSAGYGRALDNNPIDKQASLKALELSAQRDKVYYYPTHSERQILKSKEREDYYFEPHVHKGDSGARLWAYLDNDHKISLRPKALNSLQITLGINNNTGGGYLFSHQTLAPLWDELKKYSPTLQHKINNSFPILPIKIPHDLINLLAIENPDNQFIDALNWYVIGRIFNAYKNYDLEEEFLWDIIYKITRKYAASDNNKPEIKSFQLLYRQMVDRWFNAENPASPSEINDEDWFKFTQHSSEFSNSQKLILEKIHKNKLFDDFSSKNKIKIKNIKTPLSIKNYINTINNWVNSNKYKRQHDYPIINLDT